MPTINENKNQDKPSELLLNFDNEAECGYAVAIAGFNSVDPNDLFILSNFSSSALNLHPSTSTFFLMLLADSIAGRIQEVKQIHSVPAAIAIESSDGSDVPILIKRKCLSILSLSSRNLEDGR